MNRSEAGSAAIKLLLRRYLEKEDLVIVRNVKKHSEVSFCPSDAALYRPARISLAHFLHCAKHAEHRIKTEHADVPNGNAIDQKQWFWTHEEAHATTIVAEKIVLQVCHNVGIKHRRSSREIMSSVLLQSQHMRRHELHRSTLSTLAHSVDPEDNYSGLIVDSVILTVFKNGNAIPKELLVKIENANSRERLIGLLTLSTDVMVERLSANEGRNEMVHNVHSSEVSSGNM